MEQKERRPRSANLSPANIKTRESILLGNGTRVKLIEALRAATICAHCGGDRTQVAQAWAGHGTGMRGEVVYKPTRFEELTPFKHCACPSGRLWTRVYSLMDEEGQREMSISLRMWEDAGRPDFLYLPDGDSGDCIQITLKDWREYLQSQWAELTGRGN